jgi:hypothetical protein
MTQLPDEMIARAFRASNGELAWKRSDALQVVAAMADAGIGILGGEAWAPLEDGRIYVGARLTVGSVTGPYNWETDPAWQQGSESWSDFCRRAARQSEAVLSEAEVFEAGVDPELRPRIRYNLAYVTRAEYLELREWKAGGETDS